MTPTPGAPDRDGEGTAPAASAHPGSQAPEGGASPDDIVGRHSGRLVRRTALVSALTLVSRILGFVREMLSAWLFGDKSGMYDAFLTAWRVPNLFRRFLGEGALSTSFQTALTRTDGDHGSEEGARLFRETLRTAIALLVGLCLALMGGVWLVPDSMPFTQWQWLGPDSDEVRELAVRLAPFVVLICVSALIGGALQVRGHFSSPAWAPAVLNVVWIAALVLLFVAYGWPPEEGHPPGTQLEMARWLAWGALLAGLAQVVVQVPYLARNGLALRARASAGRRSERPEGAPTAGGVFRKAAPLALGAAVYQINVMIDGLMAEGLLPDGGPSLHYFANRVQQFPMALIAFAATAAVFPALQAHGHRGDREAVRRLHDRTHRAICFVALPASVGLFVLATPMLSAFFEHGDFDREGVERMSPALRWLTVAILPAGASGLVARTYYSLGDFRSPVRISAVMLLVNVVLNVVCIQGLGMDVDGLAAATATTSWGTLAWMVLGLRAKLQLPSMEPGFWSACARMGLAAALMGVVVRTADGWLTPGLGPAVSVVLATPLGVAVYFLAASLTRVPEAASLRERIARKLTR